MTTFTVKQGNTSPVISVGSSSMIVTTDWTCSLRVLDPDGTAIVSKTITDVDQANEKFLAWLTPAETGAIAVETYRLVIELSNATLTPPFNIEQQHILVIDPEMEIGDATGLVQLVAGTNSFDTLENLYLRLGQAPSLDCAISADRNAFKGALIHAYDNIGYLTTDFEVEDLVDGGYKTSTATFSASDLTALDASDFDVLVKAQLVEANALLGANPVEDRRRSGMLSDSVGESAIFFRTSKPLELPVYRDTAIAMKGFTVWTKCISR